MPPKKRRNRRDPKRTATRPAGRRPSRPSVGSDIPDVPEFELLAGLDAALREPHPIAFLLRASTLVAALDPRERDPFDEADANTPPLSLPELCEMFLETGHRQTDALLLVLARMQNDDALAARIRRQVAERRHRLPGWLLRLDQVEPYRAVEMAHVLGDGDNVVIGVRLPGGRECSILVYIDHNLGTVVKDAFVLDRSIAETVDAWMQLDAESGADLGELSLADARAKIAGAIEASAATFPPFETETWPAARPLTEWMLSLLPPGGTGYAHQEWTEEELAAISDEFFASTFAQKLDDEGNRMMAQSLLEFGATTGLGDPLRWTPVSVEIVLMDWIPRKLAVPVDDLLLVPELLRALVRYSHAVRGLSGELTAQTLASLDKFEPEFVQAVHDPGRQEHTALLQELAGITEESRRLDSLSPSENMLEWLAHEVGGGDILDNLDTAPLPDEEFDWSQIPDDIHERVAEMLDLVDGCCAELFDKEFRTACRRLLADITAGDPQAFRRRSSARTSAAAVCWMIGQANASFSQYGTGILVKDLMGHFGISGSVSQRVELFRRALGLQWRYRSTSLDDRKYLVGSRRADLIGVRDYYRGLPSN